MDWTKGYSASYFLAIVDPVTWRDVSRIEITGGSVSRERDGLMESASIDCVGYSGGEQWVRIYLDARQGGSYVRVPLFTGLATSPDNKFNGSKKSNQLDGYSALKPADDVMLPLGWYVSAGTTAERAIQDLFADLRVPVIIEAGSPALSSSIVAEEDETRLSMAEKVLEAAGWRMRIDGYGRVHVEPYSDEVAAILDPLDNDIIETEITVSSDWYECPNIFRAIADDMVGVARDDSPSSPLSTVNRGREVWMQETGCNLSENESVGDYAARRLKEEQRISQAAEYSRRFLPEVYPGDTVMMRYPEQGLNGLFMVESQDIDLGFGAQTSETITTKE